jgi:hypothetical protein
MPLDPSIPLAARAPDLASALNSGLQVGNNYQSILQQRQEAPIRQALLQNQVDMLPIQKETAQLNLDELKNSHDMKSVVYGALSVKPFLDSGDTQGALNALNARRQQIAARKGDTSDTDSVIAQLQAGDIQGAQQSIGGAINLGTQLGLIKPGAQLPDTVQELVAAGYKPGTPEYKDAYFRAKGQDKTMTPYQAAQLGIERDKLQIERDKLDNPTSKTFAQATDLRKEFIAQSKDYALQNDAIGRISAAAKDPSAAGDLALIFSFMKVQDPGSTVREGEFATAQNAGGVPDRAIAAYNKVLSGERLSPDQRKDFVNSANKLYAQAKQQHRKRESEYSRLAKQNNIDPSNVVVDFSTYQPDGESSGGVQEGATATNPQTGEQIIFRGGKWQVR